MSMPPSKKTSPKRTGSDKLKHGKRDGSSIASAERSSEPFVIDLHHLIEPAQLPNEPIHETARRLLVEQALLRSKSQAEAAERLGITDRALCHWLKCWREAGVKLHVAYGHDREVP
jgi:hypothetical protein